MGTRGLLILAVFFSACSTEFSGSHQPLLIAENLKHVATITTIAAPDNVSERELPPRLWSFLISMREAPGNVSVTVLRRQAGAGPELSIVSEWLSADDAHRFVRDALFGELGRESNTQEFEVTFEAIQFDVPK